MSFPTVTVEVAFASTPLETSPTWTDITAYVYSLSTKTGRTRPTQRFDVGTLVLELDNKDRRFDPLYSSGPYYGNLLPNKQVRVRATYNAVTYDVFYGWVDNWPQNYSTGFDSVSTVSCSDAFKLLAATHTASSVYEWEVLQDTPYAWWDWAETAGTAAVDKSGNKHDITFTQDFSSAARGSTPLRIDGPSPLAWPFYGANVPTLDPSFISDPLTIETWVNFPSTDTTGVATVWWSGTLASGTYDALEFRGSHYTNRLSFYNSTGTNNAYTYLTNTGFDGVRHHISVVRNLTTAAVYVDGTLQTTTDTNGGITAPVPFLSNLGDNNAGADYSISAGATPQFNQWNVGDFAYYHAQLAAADVLRHYEAGAFAWSLGTTPTTNDYSTVDLRIGKVLDEVSWPSSFRNIDAGLYGPWESATQMGIDTLAGLRVSYLGPAHPNGAPVLDYLHKVTESEGGYLYCDHRDGGKVRYVGRYGRSTATRSTNSQYTVSDDPTASNVYRYELADFQYDQVEIINDVTIKFGKSKVQVTDTNSIAAYGRKAKTYDTEVRNALGATPLAQWIVSRYKDPGLRVRKLQINAGADNSAFTMTLGAKIGDRVTVRRLPQNVGSAITRDVIVEGIDHQWSRGRKSWVTTFNTSDIEAQMAWVLDVGVLDSTTRPG